VQIVVVAKLCKHLGIQCQVHVPAGKETDETTLVAEYGAEVIRHKPGYSSVIAARCREAAGYDVLVIPPGLDCQEAIASTAAEACALPIGAKRVVVCGGSGMTAAGVLHGTANRELEVVVVEVGANTTKMITKHASLHILRATIIPPATPYNKPATVTSWRGIDLDPYYEAKCIPHLRPGDLFWISAHRKGALVDGPIPDIVCASSVGTCDAHKEVAQYVQLEMPL
jgi:hypothetical protein